MKRTVFGGIFGIICLFLLASFVPPPEQAAAAFYAIGKSLRFNNDDTAALSKTFSGAPDDRKKGTFSVWIKRGNLGTRQTIAASYDGTSGNSSWLEFGAGGSDADSLSFAFGGPSVFELRSSALFRDPATWFHIVAAWDTTQTTASERVKLYANGEQITNLAVANYPAQNDQYQFALANSSNRIGAQQGGVCCYFDGFVSEFYFIDGQQLTPSSFGQTDDNGYWRAKKYTGTYGTNGFYLAFGNSSSLGIDSSGNSNTWTANSMVATDQTIDTPTNSFAAGNPLQPSSGTFTDGNLSNSGTQRATFFPVTGKWYWEVKAFGAGVSAGVITEGGSANTTSASNGSTIGLRFDADAGTLSSTTDGVSFIGEISGLTGGRFPYATGGNNNFIFGQGATSSLTYNAAAGGYFTYTPPAGYKALATRNVSDPSVRKPRSYFGVAEYTGTGAGRSISDFGFQPDLVWIKNRTDASTNHALFDAVRGVQRFLSPNATNAEDTDDTQSLSSFDATGFSLGTGASTANVNASTKNYVAWGWRESATPGFDIVTYTGNGSNRTVSHGLSSAPEMIIIKDRTAASTNDWAVYHAQNTSAPETDYLLLNSTAATADDNTYWNDTAPTASVFSLSTNADVNTTDNTYVAYLFDSIEGFSDFGSYAGNGSADGPFVWTGFTPRFLLIKRTDTTGNWEIFDSSRDDTYANATSTGCCEAQPADEVLYPNLADAQATQSSVDWLSNGYKMRDLTAVHNASGGTYVYAAFADVPFKYSGSAPLVETTTSRTIRLRGGTHIRGGAHIRG